MKRQSLYYGLLKRCFKYPKIYPPIKNSGFCYFFIQYVHFFAVIFIFL